MNAKIYKINKDTLLEMSSDNLSVSNVQSLFIEHVHDNSVSEESTLSFSISIDNGHVPYIKEEEFMIVIREKVDATSRGPHDATITNAGDDVGRFDYNKKTPYRPWELPQGFTELKEENE